MATSRAHFTFFFCRAMRFPLSDIVSMRNSVLSMRVFARFCKRLLSLKDLLARAAARLRVASRGVGVKASRDASQLAGQKQVHLSRLCFAVGSRGRAEGLAGERGKIGGERSCPLLFSLMSTLSARPLLARKPLVGAGLKSDHSTCKEAPHESEVRSPLHPCAR